MASLPHGKTIDSYLIGSPASERHPHSRTVDEHNKEHQHERKIATYLVENFKYTYDLEDYIYVTQLNQAEAMTCALRSWRREWQGKDREYCGGALIWQVHYSRLFAHALDYNELKLIQRLIVQQHVASNLEITHRLLQSSKDGLFHC